MGPVEELNPTHCGDLRASYKQAFAIWAREASRLQARVADPAASAAEVENARRLAEKAHVVYRESRDLLWECMTG